MRSMVFEKHEVKLVGTQGAISPDCIPTFCSGRMTALSHIYGDVAVAKLQFNIANVSISAR